MAGRDESSHKPVNAGSIGTRGMIGRGFKRTKPVVDDEAQGFDAFELRLGDMMRGERATMGKSLLDVQRELKIKAAYIAAIENADPTAFDTPGFIAGYVRSYARYLNMDADWAFDTFCRESGFATAHGMSSEASSLKAARQSREDRSAAARDIFSASATPFIPAGERLFASVEPRAVGSVLVLVALIGGLGFGGWSVLQEVQKVRFAPSDEAPTVVAEIDPLAGASRSLANRGTPTVRADATPAPTAEALDRLYRPQALDVPVFVARDGPIVSLNRDSGTLVAARDVPVVAPLGARVAQEPARDIAEPQLQLAEGPQVQVTEGPVPEMVVVAARPAWVRVRSADGSTLFESTMQPGDTYVVPALETAPEVRIGESGAIYFAVNGLHYGPAGPRGAVSTVALSVDALTADYAVADLDADAALAEAVRVAEVTLPVAAEAAPTED